MRGDRLARQWLVKWGIEANPNELTVAGIFRPDGAQGTARKRSWLMVNRAAVRC